MNRVFEAKVVSKSIISLENNSQFTKFHVFIHIHILRIYIQLYSSNNKKLQISHYTVFHVLLTIFQTIFRLVSAVRCPQEK